MLCALITVTKLFSLSNPYLKENYINFTIKINLIEINEKFNLPLTIVSYELNSTK